MIRLPSRPHPVQPHLRNGIVKVARHEIGHLIAAKTVGFKTGDITIEQPDQHGRATGGCGITLARPLRSVADAEAHLSDRVVVLWAGAAAETLQGGKVDPSAAWALLKSEWAAQDHAKATELLNLLRNFRFPDAQSQEEQQAGLTRIEEEVWKRMVTIVEAEEALIVGLASRVAHLVRMTATKYTLSDAEITATPNIIKRFPPQ